MDYTHLVKNLTILPASNGGSTKPQLVTMPTLRDVQNQHQVEIRLRLIPDFSTDPISAAPYLYHFHGMKNPATGVFTSIACPPVGPDKRPTCPICQRALAEWNRRHAHLDWNRQEEYLLNALVIDNPLNPAQNGTVRVLKFRKQLKEVIDSALTGRDAATIGTRLFRLGPDGRTLVVRADPSGGYPNYGRSFIDSPERSQRDTAHLSESLQNAIYGQSRPLAEVFPPSTPEEAETWFQTHVLGQGLPADPPDAPMPF